MIYDELYAVGSKHAKQTIWVFSDLQQARFENAERCLNISMEDYYRLGRPADMIWYLGDSTEGSDLNALYKMTALQEDAYDALGVPLMYATGNHDYDYSEFLHRQGSSETLMPFYEMDWKFICSFFINIFHKIN